MFVVAGLYVVRSVGVKVTLSGCSPADGTAAGLVNAKLPGHYRAAEQCRSAGDVRCGRRSAVGDGAGRGPKVGEAFVQAAF
jgi:hypothetical protein